VKLRFAALCIIIFAGIAAAQTNSMLDGGFLCRSQAVEFKPAEPMAIFCLGDKNGSVVQQKIVIPIDDPLIKKGLEIVIRWGTKPMEALKLGWDPKDNSIEGSRFSGKYQVVSGGNYVMKVWIGFRDENDDYKIAEISQGFPTFDVMLVKTVNGIPALFVGCEKMEADKVRPGKWQDLYALYNNFVHRAKGITEDVKVR
jgi:hypothetical protein